MATSTALVAVTRAMTAFIARTVERKLTPSTSLAFRRPMSSRRGDARAVTARADLGRERASELASGSDFGRGDESDDPLVHMGRVNKSALKRIGTRDVLDARASGETDRRTRFSRRSAGPKSARAGDAGAAQVAGDADETILAGGRGGADVTGRRDNEEKSGGVQATRGDAGAAVAGVDGWRARRARAGDF